MKRIILCADDYGQNPAISQAIINLIEKNRLSATSCMVNTLDWLGQANALEPFQSKVDIGLHFNLTEGQPISNTFGVSQFPSLSVLLAQAFLRKLSQKSVEDEFNAQLDRFSEGMHQLPHFIDGHQHIHQFPIIRDAILSVYEKRLKNKGVYIRVVDDPQAFFRFKEDAYLKRLIIQFTGAKALKKRLIQRQIPHNASFSGIYSFAPGSQYSAIFPHFLTQITDNGLIMCHPGMQSQEVMDPIYQSREVEYQYFSSEQFAKDCQSKQIVITRFGVN